MTRIPQALCRTDLPLAVPTLLVARQSQDSQTHWLAPVAETLWSFPDATEGAPGPAPRAPVLRYAPVSEDGASQEFLLQWVSLAQHILHWWPVSAAGLGSPSVSVAWGSCLPSNVPIGRPRGYLNVNLINCFHFILFVGSTDTEFLLLIRSQKQSINTASLSSKIILTIFFWILLLLFKWLHKS